MNRETLIQLKAKEILTPENLDIFRRLIKSRNSEKTDEELDGIFASVLLRILEANMPKLSENRMREAKEYLLRHLFSKPRFSIDASEIFGSAIAVCKREDIELEEINQWLKKQHLVTVSQEALKRFADKLNIYDRQTIVSDLLSIVHEIERIENIQAVEEKRKETIILPLETTKISEDDDSDSSHGILARLLEGFETLRSHYRTALIIATPVAIAVLLMVSLYMEPHFYLEKRQDVFFVDANEGLNDKYMSLKTKVFQSLIRSGIEPDSTLSDELHPDLKYVEVSKEALQNWLKGQHSMLAEEPFITEILATARRYDVNPLLLIAIAGQEQLYVPLESQNANKMVNNPFNVFGSWQKYNTNIRDSSRLAASLIISAGKNRPAYMDPILWLNRVYAKDPNWWKGVDQIYTKLKQDLQQQNE